MSGLTGQPWFWPAMVVVIGLPLALLLLNEVHSSLVSRGSAYVKPIALLRNWLLPAAAAYLLIDQLTPSGVDSASHATWSKIAATVVGFLIMLILLSGANAALFGEARTGSWRQRLPGVVGNPHLCFRQGDSNRAGDARTCQWVGGDDAGLGHAIALEDAMTGPFFERRESFR